MSESIRVQTCSFGLLSYRQFQGTFARFALQTHGEHLDHQEHSPPPPRQSQSSYPKNETLLLLDRRSPTESCITFPSTCLPPSHTHIVVQVNCFFLRSHMVDEGRGLKFSCFAFSFSPRHFSLPFGGAKGLIDGLWFCLYTIYRTLQILCKYLSKLQT